MEGTGHHTHSHDHQNVAVQRREGPWVGKRIRIHGPDLIVDEKYPDNEGGDEKHPADDGFALQLAEGQDQLIVLVAGKMLGLHKILLLYYGISLDVLALFCRITPFAQGYLPFAWKAMVASKHSVCYNEVSNSLD